MKNLCVKNFWMKKWVDEIYNLKNIGEKFMDDKYMGEKFVDKEYINQENIYGRTIGHLFCCYR